MRTTSVKEHRRSICLIGRLSHQTAFYDDGEKTRTVDAAGRRIGCDKSGSAFATPDTYAYLYNARSELTNATAAVDAAYRYGYDFDDIGTRRSSLERNAQSVEYAANALNQYTSVDTFTPECDADANQTLVKSIILVPIPVGELPQA